MHIHVLGGSGEEAQGEVSDNTTLGSVVWCGFSSVGSVVWGSVVWGSVVWGSVVWGSVVWGSVVWGLWCGVSGVGSKGADTHIALIAAYSRNR